MGLYKRGKTWHIDYRFPPGRAGKRIREKVGPDKEEARILLGERLKDIRHGKNPELRKIAPRAFAEVVKEFEEKYVPSRRNPESYKVKLRVLDKAFAGMTLQEITAKAVEDFIAARMATGMGKATANRYRAALGKVFSWSINRGYFGSENPVKRVTRFAESPGRARFLSSAEATKLIESAPSHLRPVIVCALHTGGRLREVLTLTWEDVDLDRGVLYFDQTNTKSGKQREVPIDSELRAVLVERRKVRPIAGDAREFIFTRYGKRLSSIRTAFEKARVRAGLGEDVTFHVLRHSFASWYVINGGDLYRLQRYLGHSTIALTQRYAHLSAGHLQEGVRYFGAPAEARGHAVDTSTGPVGS